MAGAEGPIAEEDAVRLVRRLDPATPAGAASLGTTTATAAGTASLTPPASPWEADDDDDYVWAPSEAHLEALPALAWTPCPEGVRMLNASALEGLGATVPTPPWRTLTAAGRSVVPAGDRSSPSCSSILPLCCSPEPKSPSPGLSETGRFDLYPVELGPI